MIKLDNGIKMILDWLELHGDNYEDQVDTIVPWFVDIEKKTEDTITRVLCDEVGNGDPCIDMLRRRDRHSIDGFRWNATSHHDVFKYLWLEINKGRVWYPSGAETQKSFEFKHFEQQFINLNKEYRGNLMSCHHPEEKNAHDDYCSSLALVVYATLEPTKFVEMPDMSKFFDGEFENKEEWR